MIYHKLCKISESWGWNTQRGRKPFDDAKQRDKLEQCGLEESGSCGWFEQGRGRSSLLLGIKVASNVGPKGAKPSSGSFKGWEQRSQEYWLGAC